MVDIVKADDRSLDWVFLLLLEDRFVTLGTAKDNALLPQVCKERRPFLDTSRISKAGRLHNLAASHIHILLRHVYMYSLWWWDTLEYPTLHHAIHAVHAFLLFNRHGVFNYILYVHVVVRIAEMKNYWMMITISAGSRALNPHHTLPEQRAASFGVQLLGVGRTLGPGRQQKTAIIACSICSGAWCFMENLQENLGLSLHCALHPHLYRNFRHNSPEVHGS